MNKIFYFLFFAIFAIGCQSNKKNESIDSILNDSNTIISEDAIIFESDDDAPEVITAVMKIIRDNYNSFSRFVDQPQYVNITDVKDRFKVSGEFTSLNKGEEHHEFYEIYIQKINTQWEYGTLMIGASNNLKLGTASFISKGQMNSKANSDGIGEKINVAGIEFTIAEKKPDAIRIYTQDKLNDTQIKNVLKELKSDYSIIYLATSKKHERGDEYVSLAGNTYINSDTGEIISADKYFN